MALAVVLQGLIGHDRAEIGATDTNVDHVAYALAGMPSPLAVADLIRKCRHLVEHGVDLKHYVPAIHHNRLVLHCSQRDVHNGAFLREIDLLTVKHGVDPLAQAALIREFEQQPDRLIGDAVLRVVEVETYSLKREVLGALGIFREKLAEVRILYLGDNAVAEPSRRVACTTE